VLDDTLHLVRWGNLVFAVPEKRLAEFRAEVADGASFPSFAFRSLGQPVDGEHPRRPDGEPQTR